MTEFEKLKNTFDELEMDFTENQQFRPDGLGYTITFSVNQHEKVGGYKYMSCDFVFDPTGKFEALNIWEE